MLLGPVISMISGASFPVDAELALVKAVAEPVEAHVHSLGAFGLDRVVSNAFCCCIVSLDGCGLYLRVTHVFQDVTNHGSLLSTVEKSSCFALSG